MKFVEPIRDLKKIENIKKILKSEKRYKNLLLFTAWINFALRIGDLIKLKVWDLYNEDLSIKDFLYIKEAKTWKSSKRTITDSVKDILILYKENYPKILENRENYLFFRSKEFPLWKNHISRRQWLNLVSDWCESVGLVWNFWSHTLRKTWRYQARKNDIPLEIIQYKLNHSSLKITERYIWITWDEIEFADRTLNL